MASEFAAARTFVRGAARFRDLVYVLSKGKALVEEDIAHTSIIAVDAGQWGSVDDTDWDATAIAVARMPAEQLVVVGEDGDVIAYAGGNLAFESLPAQPVLIRNARSISGLAYACGMKRQVYKRIGEDAWIDLSAPFPAEDEEVGFESIDGFSESEIYAVGWGGEVWEFDGRNWMDRNSPTNVILTTVCCTPSGVVYAAGQQGVMLQGQNSSWQVIPWDDDISADIWDLCWFQDKLYVATINALYTLDGNTLTPVDFGDVPITTCYSLTTAENVLWSIGSNDVASFDGAAWQRFD